MKTQNILALNLILLAGVVCHPAVQKEKTAGVHKLLLISFDGFRWNYDEDVDTPYLDYLANEGVKAKYITPPFVTMTSPSHFTIITGSTLKGKRLSSAKGLPHLLYNITMVKLAHLEYCIQF
uniref:Uncharacterized protein n=1 Tax=Laticauda laticaudata TaxID=8630 RepID=A0A8C5RKZ5_LATLA